MRNAKDAAAYGAELRRICRFLGISDGNMAEGSMRCDVNISVRPKGQDEFGTKVEVKNMNSFSNMQKAIEFEIERQVRVCDSLQNQLAQASPALVPCLCHTSLQQRHYLRLNRPVVLPGFTHCSLTTAAAHCR